MQTLLSQSQIEAFYHDNFVKDQVRQFRAIAGRPDAGQVVVDIGGGCGFFADSLGREADLTVRVIDTDATSVLACSKLNVAALQGDALAPPVQGDEAIVCFNLILHHLVGPSERATRALQRDALAFWRLHGTTLFVNEYIYESWFPDFSGWLILQVTKSRLLSAIGRVVSRFVPSLRANTFGVGVRFRSEASWREVFAEAGYKVAAVERGTREFVSGPRRLLMIRDIRRDSFLLAPLEAV